MHWYREYSKKKWTERKGEGEGEREIEREIKLAKRMRPKWIERERER